MRNLRSSLNTLILAAVVVTPLACSSPEHTARISGQRENAGASAEALQAKIVSVALEGDLCPSGALDGNGIPSNVDIGEDGSVRISNTADGDAASSIHSCTVTIEAEVPAGFRMGTPKAIWIGYWSGDGESVSVTRDYSFENGDSASAEPRSDLADNFVIEDSSLPTFSPTCSEQRVRLSAHFQAQVRAPETTVSLNNVELYFAWRLGTDFKEGCSPGVVVDPSAGALGEWCGGSHQRPCQGALSCEFDARVNARGEGTCVDAVATPPAAPLRGDCGGPRNIPCVPGTVCWHASQSAIDRALLGICLENPAGIDGETGDACGYGIPALACQAGLYCSPVNQSCRGIGGKWYHACGEPGMAECESPLVCDYPAGWKSERLCL